MARLPRRTLGARKRAVLGFIRRNGLLLQADAELTSIATMVAGEPVEGSWWAHERAHDIYEVCVWLASQPDVLELKLVKRKVTHVHRTLWSAVFTIATSNDRWQRTRLSAPAKRLLARVNAEGCVRTDQYRRRLKDPGKLSAAVRQLEERLLVLSEEIHTPSGAHAKVLHDWRTWADRQDVRAIAPAAATESILTAVGHLGTDSPARYLPFFP